MASFASPYRRCADQPMVSSSSLPEKIPQPARSSTARARSKLERMGSKNYSVAEDPDWEESFAAPMRATVPSELGGLRLDQALARLFPQYSRNRLQAWLKSGHITLDGRGAEASEAVTGGESVGLEPPPAPDAAPKAQPMPPKILHEDADVIVMRKPPGLDVQ